jgi:hypothetical protein
MNLKEVKIVMDAHAEADKLGMDHVKYFMKKASPEVKKLMFKQGEAAVSLLLARMKSVV